MPNSKYTPPALRLIVTESGAQYPAFSDGTRFPKVCSTIVTQTSEQAFKGIATIKIEMLVFEPNKFNEPDFCEFDSGTLKYRDNQIELETFEFKKQDPDIPHLYELRFTTQVYPDPTTI